MSMRPSQKAGTDIAPTAIAFERRSTQPSGREAAATPSGMATRRLRSSAAPASCNVLGSRAAMVRRLDVW
jgi:hypothetical protein